MIPIAERQKGADGNKTVKIGERTLPIPDIGSIIFPRPRPAPEPRPPAPEPRPPAAPKPPPTVK